MKIQANGKMIFLSGIRIVNMCEQLFLGLKISPGPMCTGGMVGGKGQKIVYTYARMRSHGMFGNIYHDFSVNVTQYISSYISQITEWTNIVDQNIAFN